MPILDCQFHRLLVRARQFANHPSGIAWTSVNYMETSNSLFSYQILPQYPGLDTMNTLAYATPHLLSK
jgi:hypothetical protein